MKSKSILIKLILVIGFVLMSNSQGLFAQNSHNYGRISYLKAINVAGKQRMLSQVMSKSYLYLIDNPKSTRASRDLLVYRIIFDKQLELLEDNSTSRDVNEQIVKVKKLWLDFKSNIEEKPTYNGANHIIKENTFLLYEIDSLVSLIVTESQKSAYIYSKPKNAKLSEIINISGKQRMLSQRLAVYYYASKNNYYDHIVSKSIMEDVFTELNVAIETLLLSSFNTSDLEINLGIAMSEFEKITMNKEKFFNHGFDDLDVYKIVNNMTSAFNKVTHLYEEIGDRYADEEN